MKLRNASLIVSCSFAFLAACGSGSSSGTAGNGGSGNTGNTGTGGSAASGTGGASTGGSSGTGGTSTGPCTDGQKQCSGTAPQTCVGGKWQSGVACPFGCTAGACTGVCAPGSGQCNGLVPQTCDATGNWQDGTECPFICKAGTCTGECAPGSTNCVLKIPQTCDNDGKWQSGTECPYKCENGACKDVCKAGEIHCECNTVQVCDAGPPAKWVDKSPSVVCSPSTGQKCDEATGTCKAMTPIGSTTPTGTYFQFATFNSGSGSVFLGGYDVDSYDDLIYVNRSSSQVDVYKLTLLDSDGDGKLEPDQHPSNTLNPGTVETRQLTLVKTITKAADGVPVGPASTAELYALSDRLYSLGTASGSKNGNITEWVFATKTSNVVAAATNLVPSQFGFGDGDGVFYASNESARRVYSYNKTKNEWCGEFSYPDLAGSHMDGMEVIVSPKTGEQYVYVSDMTSDFLGQYRRDPTGWTQVNLFKYADGTGSSLEGMGFGALNHFWATGGNTLYEIGGGDLSQYVE